MEQINTHRRLTFFRMFGAPSAQITCFISWVSGEGGVLLRFFRPMAHDQTEGKASQYVHDKRTPWKVVSMQAVDPLAQRIPDYCPGRRREKQ